MPFITTRDWDPTGELSAVPDENSASKTVMETIGAALNLMKSRKRAQQEKTMREKVLSGQGNVGMEYDPETGKTKYKIDTAKQDSLAAKVQRFITAQQFGVDPVTGEQIADPKKPKFGYQGNNIWQQLLQEDDPDLVQDPNQMPQAGTTPPPSAPAPRRFTMVPSAGAAQITMPGVEGGGQLSPQDHYNQLRAAGMSKDEARKIAGV